MRNPSFDTWTVIFLFAAVQAIFTAAVLIFKKKGHSSRIFLATIMLVFSMILTDYVLYWTAYQYAFPYTIFWPLCLVFLFGPLFYFYFKSIFIKEYLQTKDLLHLLPFLIALAGLSPVILSSVADKQEGLAKGFHFVFALPQILTWAGIASMCLYLLMIIRQFYAMSLLNPGVRKWFLWLTMFFAGFTFSYLSYFILCNFSFFNAAWDYSISFCMTFFIYFIAWAGYHQPKVFSGFDLFEKEKVKYKTSPVSGDPGKEIVSTLNREMAEKKYFLLSDLSLEKLSALLHVNKHYLSQAINENLGVNFFEYINQLRIKEAMVLLEENKGLTIIEVAYQVGYNNKVSFNKAFKNITGTTPTQFREKKG